MAQINTNIAYSINRFKILSDEIESHLMVKNLDDWEKGDYGFFLNANGEFENDDIDDDEEAYVYKSFVAVTNISFDYKVSSENNYDYFRVYINDDEVIKISGSHDYENYIKSFDVPTDITLKFSYKKDDSASEDDDAGYFKNLKFIFYTKRKRNGNYIRTQISKYPTILNLNSFEIKKYKNLGVFEQRKEIIEPIRDNIEGWNARDDDNSMFIEDDILKSALVTDDTYYWSTISMYIRNIIKIEFDYKTNINKDDGSYLYFDANSYTFKSYESTSDWVHKIYEFDFEGSYLTFGFWKNGSDEDEYAYFKNIKIYTDTDIIVFVNGNYIKNQISKFPTTLNHNNFKIKNFTNHNTTQPYIIKNFLTKSKKHYYRLGRDLTVPPKRIIFKNFED